MKRLAPALALMLVLIPASAQATGVNVRISQAPNGTDAGEVWVTNVIVTMPGNGRFGGVSPRMIIRQGSVQQTFPTERTGKKGVYRVSVVFPSRGTWRYGVDDGFGRLEHGGSRVHRFPPVTIAADQPTLAKPPRPISGDISDELHVDQAAPTGQLPPRTAYVPPDAEDSGDSAMIPVLAVLLGAALLGSAWLRRRHNNKRAA